MDDPTRISVRDAASRLDRHEPVTFLDSRSAQAYRDATRQIPGSIRVPPDEVEAAIDRIPTGTLLVPYCT